MGLSVDNSEMISKGAGWIEPIVFIDVNGRCQSQLIGFLVWWG